MASASSPDSALSRISRNHLECSICTERYKEPKILECLHSFCEKCLNTYATGQHPGQPKIPCPLCRQETTLPQIGISGLKTNFFITSLMEDITLQEKVADSTNKLTCDLCDKGKEAKFYCFDCPNNLCVSCSEVHRRIRDLAGHITATFKDIQQGKVQYTKQRGMPHCEKHQREVKQFFCENCQLLICRDCTVVDHQGTKGHSVVDANTAAQKLKHSLTQSLDVVVKNTKELQDSVKKALEKKNDLQQNAQKLLRNVRDRGEELRSKVTKEENTMIKRIQYIQDERLKSIDGFEEEVNAKIKRNKHSAEIAQDIMTEATDFDFLSLYPEVSRDLGLYLPDAQLDNIREIQWHYTDQNIVLGLLIVG